MPKTYTVAGARAKLAAIVDEAASGTDVEITRRGKKVAVVLSAARYARLRGDRVAFATAYDAFVAGHDMSDAGDEAWDVALRDRSPGRPVDV
jgi:prevent-host-death family protein